MDGLMRGDRVTVESSSGVSVDAMIQSGVRQEPDIDAIAAKSGNGVSVLLWNYHDDDVPAVDAPVRITITGLPASARRVLLKHYRIDRDHSNAYTVWKQMGSPQKPTPEQYAGLNRRDNCSCWSHRAGWGASLGRLRSVSRYRGRLYRWFR